MSMTAHLARCHNIDDLRVLARCRLPRPVFDFLDGAAESERTARQNTVAFDDTVLVPRFLIDVSSVKTATRVLGQDIEWPLVCSPTGGSRIFHPDGELAVARAAGRARIFYGLSTTATVSLEDIAAVAPGPKLFQLYIFKDRDMTRELIDRCKQAGYSAMCLTVDVPVVGKRERDLRSGFGVPTKWSAPLVASFARRPLWSLAYLRNGALTMPNVAHRAGADSLPAQTRYIGQQLDPSVSWRDVREMIERWGGPFAIKGVLSADDARRVADVGASAVIVSNHGGRQLDGAMTPIDALPAIAAAVGQHIEVLLDGGVRRGVHVLKALARGAKACSIGRPYLYGLSAAGEPGVAKALRILHTELIRAMQLAGCTDVRDIAPDIIAGN
ncbi:MAG TPA: alpha-hydroxy acid oxidase [Steroidobacteraceae bacterium]|jgi:L-lactate dehydrogenase (cytochrome)